MVLSKRHLTWIGLILLSCVLFLQTTPVNAQEPDPTEESDAYCVACHEHQYYVYDSGKWYCLCEARMHCVYCHGGRTDSNEEEVAHEGLVLYPTREHEERCQSCHTEDYMSRVVAFESVAGVSPTQIPIITATPVAASSLPADTASANPLSIRLGQLGTWQFIGLGALTILMIAIVVFGYRCWKADCFMKKQNQP